MFHRDKWRGPEVKKKQAWSWPQALSIELLSDPLLDLFKASIVLYFRAL